LEIEKLGKTKKNADDYLNEKIEIPPRGGNWEHNYISPETKNELERGRQIGDWKWEHRDKITGKLFLGDTIDIKKDFDGVIISLIHDSWAIGTLQLGLAYQISGNREYAQKAKDILLSYCKVYPALKSKNKYGLARRVNTGNGKVHVQDLNESIWLIDIVQGADLIWNALNKREQNLIIDSLIKPAISVIIDRPTDLSNIKCWKNAAIGITGFFLNDSKLIDYAFKDSIGGYSQQVTKGLTQEGFYADLSPGYQFYTLNALVLLAQTAVNARYTFDFQPIKKMFELPLKLANSKFLIPAFNDSRPINVLSESFLYEWAFSTFGDSSFSAVLKNINRSSFKNRGAIFTGWGLLFGKEKIPNNFENPQTNINLIESGIAKLSKGLDTANLTCYIKYNNTLSKRAHFHDAQLEFAIMKDNEYISVIPGNTNYSSPLANAWYRSSFSHNTLIVNENQQNPSSAKCLSFGSESGVNYIIVSTSNAYDSISFIRTFLMPDDKHVVIINQVDYSKKNLKTIDLNYHYKGYWQNISTNSRWIIPNKRGYVYLRDASIKYLQKDNTLINKNNGKSIYINTLATSPFDVITAYGKPFQQDEVASSIYRFAAKQFASITCISLENRQSKVEIIEHESSSLLDETSFKINFGELQYKIRIEPNSHSKKVHISKTLFKQKF